VLSAARVAAILTVGELDSIRATLMTCRESAREGATVTLFFRDETIPLICRPEVAAGIADDVVVATGREVAEMLRELVGAGDVRCTACSSSLYLWGVTASDLIPEIAGARGLVAFLAEDLAGATRILSS
jgi:peroxiredoxin family protein